ncbi:MAG: hypothetical protein R3268_03065 [Acidiferrobacterales bacterium]|nr:hypothetical protein [Acidiferrobacterales bacterium]
MRTQDLPKRAQLMAAMLRTGLSALFSAALITAAPLSLADDDNDEIPFDEAHIFFELNNTDGDLGIHALIDGEAWKKLEIELPNGREVLKINVKSRLRKQGLTEIFFESAEPPFESDDPEEVTLTPEQFFARFPEGTYEVEGETLEGDELESETEVTHVMPSPPVIQVNDMPAAADCDSDLPVVSAPVIISWEPVTMSHPDLGISGVMIDVVNYEVVVEIDETPFRNSIILPPEATEFQVPLEILDLSSLNDGEVKFEVLVREASFNQTAVESCFEVE